MKISNHYYICKPLVGVSILIIQLFLATIMAILVATNSFIYALNIFSFIILTLFGVLILYLAFGEMK